MLHCPFIDCMSLFCDDEALQKHLKSKHPDRSVRKKFSCHHPSCEYSTDNKKDLKLNMVVHTRPRAFKCNYQSCLKDFKQQSNLNRHIKTVHKKTWSIPAWFALESSLERITWITTRKKSMIKKDMMFSDIAENDLDVEKLARDTSKLVWRNLLGGLGNEKRLSTSYVCSYVCRDTTFLCGYV